MVSRRARCPAGQASILRPGGDNLHLSGLAPIYLQAGGREILRDMIVEFAETQKAKGADVTLDLWPDMPHDFQAYDSLKESSAMALARIAETVQAFVETC